LHPPATPAAPRRRRGWFLASLDFAVKVDAELPARVREIAAERARQPGTPGDLDAFCIRLLEIWAAVEAA
jgi:hypothetical protein